MRSKRFIKMAQLAALPLVLALIVIAVAGGSRPATATHETMPPNGLVCTSHRSGTYSTFTLTTREGKIVAPDGNTIYMWGFSEGDDPFQYPGPVLCVNEGDTVTIVLHNGLQAADVSLIFPGQENVMANGVPSQPVFDVNGSLTSLAPVAPASNGTMTYSFVATKPGTYIYQSGTEPLKQVNMGLFGALVVRPAAHPDWAYNEVIYSGTISYTTQFNPDAEFLLLLSEIDPMLHQAVEQGHAYDMNGYHERYWMINGRGFPDTLSPNGADWLPNQPYGAMIYIHPYNNDPGAGPAYNPHPALLRYINMQTENSPHHPHGNHARVIAHDGNVLIGSSGEDLSYEKFTVVIGPGETQDQLFVWEDVDHWDPQTKPIPVTIPQLQNLTFGALFSGSPYLGNTDQLPVGQQALNQCGEYYHISHSHALEKITAWGVVLSGQITYTRIDPPLPNNCP